MVKRTTGVSAPPAPPAPSREKPDRFCSVAEALDSVTPPGYVLVLVPDEKAPDEPDWDEVRRQAEVAYGLKVGDLTMPILIREVRRWIAHKAGHPKVGPSIPKPTLAELHEGLAAQLKDGPARNLHLETAAALRAAPPMPDLQDLHNLLYLAQRQTSLPAMKRVVGQARLELAKVRDAK
jgi:hypothetical protein